MARKVHGDNSEFSLGGHSEGEEGVIPVVEDLVPPTPVVAAPAVTPGADGNISLSAAALRDIIVTAVREATAGSAEVLKGMMPRRTIDFGEFEEKGMAKSPFNYDKKQKRYLTDREKPVLTRPCYQNGFRLFEEKLLPEEIEMLNEIHRPGRYINRIVEVVIRDEGSTEVLELRWNNKTGDQRSELKGEARNFVVILQRILEEQEQLDAEENDYKENKRSRR